ncbi:MAG: hypothetical protein ABJC98_16835 [Bacteroidota bacterium]
MEPSALGRQEIIMLVLYLVAILAILFVIPWFAYKAGLKRGRRESRLRGPEKENQ